MARLLRRYVLHNWLLKLISLLIAVLLWSAVSREPLAEITFRVPIEFHNVPENLEIVSEEVPQAQVRVRGPAPRLRELAPADVHPILDLGGSGPGERTYELTDRNVQLPGGIEVVQIVPAQFRLNFDRRAVRQVPVRPRVTGSFAAGYELQSVTAAPEMVTIAGPEKRVSEIQAALTDPIDATGVVGQQQFRARTHVPDPLVRVVRPESVQVTVVTARTD